MRHTGAPSTQRSPSTQHAGACGVHQSSQLPPAPPDDSPAEVPPSADDPPAAAAPLVPPVVPALAPAVPPSVPPVASPAPPLVASPALPLVAPPLVPPPLPATPPVPVPPEAPAPAAAPLDPPRAAFPATAPLPVPAAPPVDAPVPDFELPPHATKELPEEINAAPSAARRAALLTRDRHLPITAAYQKIGPRTLGVGQPRPTAPRPTINQTIPLIASENEAEWRSRPSSPCRLPRRPDCERTLRRRRVMPIACVDHLSNQGRTEA